MRRRRRQPKFFSRIPKSKTLTAYISLILLFLLTLILITSLSKTSTTTNSPEKIGKLGESIIQMLPSSDLAFTLFLPTEAALKRDLRLNDSSVEEDSSTHAELTRVLGFCAVPKWIWSGDLRRGKEKVFESIGGFGLHVRRDARGRMVVNGAVRSEIVDLKVGSVVVHLMDGVLMDAEFEDSVRVYDEEDEDN